MKKAKQFITKCFNKTASNAEIAKSIKDIGNDWSEVFSFAGSARITPGLYLNLKDRDLLQYMEPEATKYLKAIYKANQIRNTRILADFCEVTAKLNELGIYPTPIKGIGLLLSNTYFDIGERVLSDIDILVSKFELPQVVETLLAAGYWQTENEYATSDHYDFRNDPEFVLTHIPAFYKTGSVATFEIHLTPFQRNIERDRQLLEHILQGVETRSYNNVCLKQLSNDSHIIVGVYHSNVKDRMFSRGLLDLRHARDFDLLSERTANKKLQTVVATARRFKLMKHLLRSCQISMEIAGDSANHPYIPCSSKIRMSAFRMHNNSKLLLRLSHFTDYTYRLLKSTYVVESVRCQFGTRNLFLAYYLKLKRISGYNNICRNIKLIFNLK